jgi:hypothetical protein
MVELWLKSNITNEWVSMDIGEEIAISLNKSFEEIEDFSTIKSDFTKTFEIPQTSTNNKFFRNCFMVNSSNFSQAIFVSAVVKYGGSDVFNGNLRLNKIINQENGGTYEVFLTQSIPNLSQTLQNIKLVNLDLSELTHELNYDNIVSTWSYSGGSWDTYSGLTGKLVYPLGHYGYNKSVYFGSFDLSTSGFTNTGGALSPLQFAPWLNVKYLLDKAFSASSFTYKSDFLNSDYFNSLFALSKTNDTMGSKRVSDDADNANVFLVENKKSFTDIGSGKESFPGNFNEAYFAGFIFTDVLNDPLNIFSPSINSTPSGRGHFFTPPVNGVYKFKVSFKATLQNAFLASYLNFAIKDVDTGTIYNQVKGLVIFNSSTPTEYNDIYINATLSAGTRVALFYSRNNGGGDPFADIVFTYQKWELWTSPILSLSDNVIMNQQLPAEISSLDLFRGIINHFNLVVLPDGENNFLIEPWDSYFSSGNTLDWSEKLDYSQPQTLEPTNELNKEYILTFSDTNDLLSKENIERNNQVFGTYRLVSPEPFHTGIFKQESIFAPLPITTFDNSTESNILIPHLYAKPEKSENPDLYAPIGSPLRLGWFQGMLDSTITGATTTWYFLSGNTSVGHTTYPAISHLSSYEYTPSTFSDLNYKNQYDFWQRYNDSYVGYTSRDVYNDFWSGRLSQIYEEDTKFFTGNFYLTPEDIKNINFNDKVYFEGSYWRLYEMLDADITTESLVSCKFLKIPYDLPSKTYISPTYQQASPITPPVITGTTFLINFYSDTNTINICNETATIYPYYSNCSIISDGCSVFTNSGATLPVDEGVLLKPVGSNTIYQTQENGLIVSIQTC